MASTQGIKAGRAFVELFADDSKLVRGLRRAEKKLKAFGSSIRGYGLKVAGLGAAIIAPLAASARLFSQYGDQVAKMAKRTGLSVETLSELRFVASQTGTEFTSLEMGLRKMQRSIYDAGRGLSTQVDALADIGLTFEDLDGLSPEDQFKKLADRIGQVEDLTIRAAIAMSLFGRTGTNLLPMFAAGSAGIDALQQQARDLGLTMSGEDAKAAEDFTDALDRLWKVVRMGVFHVGAALAPLLHQLADLLTRIAVNIGGWIQRNRRVIVTVAKVAAVVVALGASLVVLGALVSGLGTAMGVLASIVTGIGAAFGVVATAIGLLVSPIGLVIVALGALGAYLAYTTGFAGRALAWLGDRFGQLKDAAVRTFRGIADALAAGDIALAAKVLWTSLQLLWQQGTHRLELIWIGFKHTLLSAWNELVAGIASLLIDLEAGVAAAWQSVTASFVKQWRSAVGSVEGLFHDLVGLIDETYDAAEAKRISDANRTADNRRTDASRDTALAEIEQQRQGRQDILSANADADRRALDTAAQSRIDEAQRELDAAKLAWRAALDEAKRRRVEADANDPNLPGAGAPEPPDLSGLEDTLARQTQRLGAVGAFNPAALLGMALGTDAAERTATAAEATARNTKKIEREIKTNNLAFA